MSSTFAPQGFLPVFHPSGQIVANPYYPTVSGGPTAAIYKGDPVQLSSDTTTITIATEGSDAALLGIFAGCEYTTSDGKPTYSPYWPGTTTGATNIVMYVYDDPFIMYDVATGGSVTAADIGLAADYVKAAGNAYNGVSASYLSHTMAADASQFRILGISPLPGNVAGDTYTTVRVKILQSQLVSEPNGV